MVLSLKSACVGGVVARPGFPRAFVLPDVTAATAPLHWIQTDADQPDEIFHPGNAVVVTFRPRRRGLLAAVLAGLLLCACTPEYNWRETVVADGNAQIAFPAQVRTEERPMTVDGTRMTFSLMSASVGPAVFAVGYALLPADASEDFGKSLVRRLVSSLAANGGEPPEGATQGDVFELETTVAGQPSRLVARVLVHRDILIEVVASGPKSALPPEQARDFMRSLVLR